jgi:PilZ domain
MESPVRRGKRSRTLISGRVIAGGEAHTVKVRDLSPQGARINGARLPVDSEITLECEQTGSVAARVAWADGTTAGIAFVNVLDLSLAGERFVPAQSRDAPKSYKRPGVRRRVDMPAKLNDEDWR